MKRYLMAFMASAGWPIAMVLLAGSVPSGHTVLTAIGAGMIGTGLFHATSPKDVQTNAPAEGLQIDPVTKSAMNDPK